MQWGFSLITLILFVGLIASLILFAPLPYYQFSPSYCKNDSKCPSIGWYFGQPFYQKLFVSYQPAVPDESFTITTKTPKLKNGLASPVGSPSEVEKITEQKLNFVFSYGVGAKNKLDTFNNTFTKDLIEDGYKTFNFSLSETDLDKIYQKMQQIKLFDYPDNLELKAMGDIDPNNDKVYYACMDHYDSYNFKFQYQNTAKKIVWYDPIACTKNDPRIYDLDQLGKLIISLIESKTEYQQLPQAKGGYL